jgi:hypothetical protein
MVALITQRSVVQIHPRNQRHHRVTSKATFSRRGEKRHNLLLRRPFSFCLSKRRPKCNLYYLAIGCPFRFHHCVPIDVYGGRNLSVPYQFLLHSHRSANRIEPRAIRVAECVPPDVAETKLAASWTNIVLLDWARIITAARDRAGEHPAFVRFRASLFPSQQDCSEIRIKRKIVFRRLGLDLVDNSSTTARVTRIMSSPKLMSRRCKARISLTLRPRPCATTTIVR